MKIQFNRVLTSLDGKTLVLNAGDTAPLTASAAVVAALTRHMEQGMSSAASVMRFGLARRIASAGDDDVDVSVEEAAEIKRILPLMFPPIVAAQIIEIIET